MFVAPHGLPPSVAEPKLGKWIGDTYAKSCRAAVGSSVVLVGGDSSISSRDLGSDFEFFLEMLYQDVKSSLAEESIRVPEDPVAKAMFLIITLDSKPSRVLLRTFLVFSRQEASLDVSAKAPDISHLVTRRLSLVVSKQQYVANLSPASSFRLLLWLGGWRI